MAFSLLFTVWTRRFKALLAPGEGRITAAREHTPADRQGVSLAGVGDARRTL
jgi:hypothetical protein